VATYKELDNDFQKHSYLMTLVGKCFTNLQHLLMVWFSLLVRLLTALLICLFLCKGDEIDLKLLGKVLAPESTVFEVRMTRPQSLSHTIKVSVITAGILHG
jgi:hypothetical protein